MFTSRSNVVTECKAMHMNLKVISVYEVCTLSFVSFMFSLASKNNRPIK